VLHVTRTGKAASADFCRPPVVHCAALRCAALRCAVCLGIRSSGSSGMDLSTACITTAADRLPTTGCTVRKTPFYRAAIFMLNAITLPRQVRYKHRKCWEREGVSCSVLNGRQGLAQGGRRAAAGLRQARRAKPYARFAQLLGALYRRG
jgi:hypothetical protein